MDLNFVNGVQTLELEQLKKTVTTVDIGGHMPSTRPVNHFDMIEQVMNIFDKTPFGAKIDKITAVSGTKEKYAKRIPKLQAIHGDYNVEAVMLDRLVVSILFDNLKGKTTGSAIALSYTDKGIQVSYGQNVWACDNMCIFGQNMLTTFGNNKTSYENILQIMNGWAGKLQAKHDFDINILSQMRETEVSPEAVINMIGKLSINANAFNIGKDVFAPLNVSQVNELARSAYKEVFESDRIAPANVFELYNLGTEMLKPDRVDTPVLLTSVRDFGQFIMDEFKISSEITEAEIVS